MLGINVGVARGSGSSIRARHGISRAKLPRAGAPVIDELAVAGLSGDRRMVSRADLEATTSRPCSVKCPRARRDGSPLPRRSSCGAAAPRFCVTRIATCTVCIHCPRTGACRLGSPATFPAAAATTANVADRVDERSLHIEIHREDEMFWARVKEWPGCYASGETLDELIEAVEEAIAMFVTPDEEQIVSLELKIKEIEVRVGSPRSRP